MIIDAYTHILPPKYQAALEKKVRENGATVPVDDLMHAISAAEAIVPHDLEEEFEAGDGKGDLEIMDSHEEVIPEKLEQPEKH